MMHHATRPTGRCNYGDAWRFDVHLFNWTWVSFYPTFPHLIIKLTYWEQDIFILYLNHVKFFLYIIYVAIWYFRGKHNVAVKEN